MDVDRIGKRSWLRRTIDVAAAALVAALVVVTLISLADQAFQGEQQGDASPPAADGGVPAGLLPKDGELISHGDAAERVHYFTGESVDLDVTFLSAESRYRVTMASPDRSADEIMVDADTGEIVTASFPSRTSSASSPAPLSVEAAEEIATEFASTHFVGFTALDVLGADERSITRPTGGLDRGYRVAWRLRDDASGTWLPTWVAVTVNLDTGEVYAYDALRHLYPGPIQPAVSRDTALLLVEETTQSDLRYGTLDVLEVFLIAHPDDTLHWVVNLRSTAASVRFTAAVDAMTGDLVYIQQGEAHP